MLRYGNGLKSNARDLRSKLTEAEQILWSRLRRKQLLGVQFNLQRPIGNYIVDFYAARAKLVVEGYGSGHLSFSGIKKNKKKTTIWKALDSWCFILMIPKYYGILKRFSR